MTDTGPSEGYTEARLCELEEYLRTVDVLSTYTGFRLIAALRAANARADAAENWFEKSITATQALEAERDAALARAERAEAKAETLDASERALRHYLLANCKWADFEKSPQYAALTPAVQGGEKPDALGHETRSSDSSLYDEICILCGATDGVGDRGLTLKCRGTIRPAQPGAAEE